MRPHRRLDLALALFAALAFSACGDKDEKKPAAGGGEAAHEHKAPHGGEVLELGNEEGHIEVLHDQAAGTMTLHIYGTSLEKPVYVKAPVLNLQTKAGPVDVPLTAADAKPDGTAHTWKAQHDGFKVEPLEGRLRVEIAGKTFQTKSLEPEGHAHK